jgi:two-component system sensor histidine kinase UhpB
MRKNLRVLLAEDNDADTAAIRNVLDKSGSEFIVKIVNDLSGFETQLKEFSPDVVLCDHITPGFDSYDILALFKEKKISIPFIVVTNKGNEQFAASILMEGADDYVWKKDLERLPATIFASLKRVQAEAKLIAGEKKFRALIENSYDIITLMNENQFVTYNSPSLKRITGWENEMQGYQEKYHEDDAIRMKRIMKEVFAKPDYPLFTTFRVKHQLGHFIWLEGTITNNLHNPYIESIVFNLRDVSEQIESYENLVRSESEMRNFAKHLNTIQEEERIRIAREIHDELGQQFIAIKMGLSSMKNSIKEDILLNKIENIISEVESGTRRMKRIATELRPGILDSLGLIPSIAWLGNEFQKKTGITCYVKFNVTEQKFEKDISTCFFRICQESLTNALKHSDASEVTITMYLENSHLNLVVSDNGKGMSEETRKNPFSMGLLGMRERAKAINAHLEIMSQKNTGTVVHLKAIMDKSYAVAQGLASA